MRLFEVGFVVDLRADFELVAEMKISRLDCCYSIHYLRTTSSVMKRKRIVVGHCCLNLMPIAICDFAAAH